MSEYEAATLAFQTASLATQHAGIWIAAAHVAVGVGQAGIVWYGIRALQRASEQRANDTRDEARRLAATDERRHTEAMRALEALIARTAPGAAGERT